MINKFILKDNPKKKIIFFIFIFGLILISVIKLFSNYKKNQLQIPAIVSLREFKLTSEEKKIFNKYNIYGVLLLPRNLDNENQVKKLIIDIKNIYIKSNRKIPLFFIDQEGGRIDRLNFIYKDKYRPSSYDFGKIAEKDLEKAKISVFKNSVEMATILKNLGIDCNLAPVFDKIYNNDDVIKAEEKKIDIGPRSFSNNIKIIKILTDEFIKGHKQVGIKTCAKHFIGLGSAEVNSHLDLPVINKNLNELQEEINSFKNIDTNYGLVAHAKYTKLFGNDISTFSNKMVNFIRKDLNFKGILISDALSMKALSQYNYEERAINTLNTGIDIIILVDSPETNETLDWFDVLDKINNKNYLRNFN